eukprot:scaffold442_cov268-Pinguiococcus_pyrenoidosus.AAC.118
MMPPVCGYVQTLPWLYLDGGLHKRKRLVRRIPPEAGRGKLLRPRRQMKSYRVLHGSREGRESVQVWRSNIHRAVDERSRRQELRSHDLSRKARSGAVAIRSAAWLVFSGQLRFAEMSLVEARVPFCVDECDGFRSHEDTPTDRDAMSRATPRGRLEPSSSDPRICGFLQNLQ